MSDVNLARVLLTAERLREVLAYDQETGDFTWRSDNTRVKAGQIAGGIDTWGYRQIKIGGKLYLAHRLAWLYVTGVWPEAGLDHCNCDKLDNRFSNLRLADSFENARNKPRRRDNTSGYKGIYKAAGSNRWAARIVVNRKQLFLGRFATPEAAHQAYRDAAKQMHGAFANVS